MKKCFDFILILLISILGYSCKTQQNNDNLYSVSLSSVYDSHYDTLTVIQMDSMIQVDSLPKYEKWQKVYLKDYETGQPYEYATLYDQSSDMIYTVKYRKNEQYYIVLKRKTSHK